MRFLTFSVTAAVAFLAFGCSEKTPSAAAECRQATGVKVGEVTSNSAIVWTRLTESEARRPDGLELRGRPDRDAPPRDLDRRDLEGSALGAPGRVMLRYGLSEDLSDATETEWESVRPEKDFTRHFKLKNLAPGSKYYFETLTADSTGHILHKPLTGSFQTAPAPDKGADVRFTVITGQAYRDADDPDGFKAYDAMLRLDPHFIVPTGDSVYYDSDDPLAVDKDLARYHWCRMYSYPKLVEFHRYVPGYWEKDDHDSYANDNWPGLVRPYMGTFSFEQGLEVFREQLPVGKNPYRKVRWGKHLEVWLVEGRDFRSPNDMPDGPDKTIWGEEQKEWLTKTLVESDADWKVLVSPTPIVGPDRGNKADNHANEAFAYEGNWFRKWAADNLGDNFFIACGDRHWQYHSVDPATGVQEFSSGPISDQHASGSPGLDEEYHRYHNMQGGFLSVSVESGQLAFRFHGVDGEVDYEFKPERK